MDRDRHRNPQPRAADPGSCLTTEATIEHDGDVWRVLGKGVKADGRTICHLASTTRFRAQRNGQVPIQINDWVNDEVLKAALHPAPSPQRA